MWGRILVRKFKSHSTVAIKVSFKVSVVIYNWLGISVVAPQLLPDHFIQFSYFGGSSKVRQSNLQFLRNELIKLKSKPISINNNILSNLSIFYSNSK